MEKGRKNRVVIALGNVFNQCLPLLNQRQRSLRETSVPQAHDPTLLLPLRPLGIIQFQHVNSPARMRILLDIAIHTYSAVCFIS